MTDIKVRSARARPETATADWRHFAACSADDPELWCAEPGTADAEDASRTCHQCPVRRDCGVDAAAKGLKDVVAAGFHTGTFDGREALRAWLGWPSLRQPRTCSACGAAFWTERPRVTRCEDCMPGSVDAAPVHALIDKFRSVHGMTDQAIGELVGKSAKSVQAIRSVSRVQKSIARQFLLLEVGAAG